MVEGAAWNMTKHPQQFRPNVDYIIEDMGLDIDNVVFGTLENAKTTIGRWIKEETSMFNKITGWDWEADFENWDDDYKRCVRMCIDNMVKKRILQRKLSMSIDNYERATTLGTHTAIKDVTKMMLEQLLKGNPKKPVFTYFSAIVRGGEYMLDGVDA